MTDSVFTSFGGLDLPVSEEDVDNSLSTLDPARDRMLAWFAAAINAEFAAAWTEATAALPPGHKLIGTSPVEDLMPFEPTVGLMRQRKAGYPLLAVHRTGDATFAPLTLEEDSMTQTWHVHHIIGPVDVEGQRRILDIGQAVGKLLAMTIRDFGHPAYENGANQLEAGDIHALSITTMTGPGPAQFDGDADNTIYWATRFTLQSLEYSEPNDSQVPPFNGWDVTMDVGGASEENISFDFIEVSSDAPQ